ncbi:MAG: ABC transporter ATP-binding protein [Candidatus Schekmanbacteria bacterium]|nr:ABC transporter ATP-binding protein [Candidatus Schekmanbacteria bacterium]
MASTESSKASKVPALLRVEGLRAYFSLRQGMLRAVEDVSFEVPVGRIVGLVGESGSGKTVTAYSTAGLEIGRPGIIGGHVFLGDRDLFSGLEQSCRIDAAAGSGKTRVRKNSGKWSRQLAANYRGVRGSRISMIFQEPQSSLDPLFSIERQITEPLLRHGQCRSRREARGEALEWLRTVAIHAPERVLSSYPHELSGGMCQRVMLAIAMASRPQLLIADEPTTALDATIQVQILSLLRQLNRQRSVSVLLITHDIQIVYHYTDLVVVMYAGYVMERNSTAWLLDPRLEDKHPYTRALLASVPYEQGAIKVRRLTAVQGESPNPFDVPQGCPFHPRCQMVVGEQCRRELPPLLEIAPGHHVRCWRWSE